MADDDAPAADAWTDGDSRLYLRYRDVFVPRAEEIRAAVLAPLSRPDDGPEVIVELGPGDGALAAAILRARPRARMVLVDRSALMLRLARETLAGLEARATLLQADLRDHALPRGVPERVDAFVSVLALHHLRPEEHADLYAQIHARLRPGGRLVVADLVRPEDPTALRHHAEAWNRAALAQSLSAFGDERGYRAFVASGWNHFERGGDAGDVPLSQAELAKALRSAGFRRIDILWAHAGHHVTAAYGESAEESP